MLKRMGLLAALAACSSQNDITQVAALDPLPAGPQPAAPGAGATPSATYGARAPSAVGSRQRPAFGWARPGSAAPPPASITAVGVEQAARTLLTSPSAPQPLTARRAEELQLEEIHDTGKGVIVARFERRVAGLRVFGQQVSVALDRNLGALAASGDVSGEASTVSKAQPGAVASGFALGPEQAVISAVAAMTGVLLEPAELGSAQPGGGEYESVELGQAALSRLGAPPGTRPARARMTLFPTATKQLEPAYYVEAEVGPDAEGRPRYHAHVISAATGAVLWKRDLTADAAFTDRVYADDGGLNVPWDGPQGTELSPHPAGEPIEGFSPAFVPSQRVTLSSLEAVGVADPWLPDGARETVGNNVDAYLDLTEPDGFTLGTDFRGQVSAPGVFDASFDPLIDANSTTAQQTAAVTQLFYNINWFHDWYYAAGFTEAAGNAQLDNFGRGGVAGDPIRAEAQDGGDTNNANMSTPADGAPPRMQMYLWDFGRPSLTVSGPEGVAGSYRTGAADFAPRSFEVSGKLVRATPIDGCTPLVGEYAGAVVLVDRGGDNCTFGLKATNAQEAGAAGVLIANVPTSNAPETAPTAGGTPPIPITIGVLTLNLADGDRLRAALADGSEVSASLARDSKLRDGDVDNQIVAHEWGHYISNRLVLDSAGLGTNMAGGLGEGWADFHALLMTVRAEDVEDPTNASWNGVYGIGGYASAAFSDDGYYFGTRRYPYSTDTSKDPLTFKHISNEFALPDGPPRAFDADHTEVHNVGEVWATMLWECYAALLRDTLGEAPRLTFAEARDRMRDYLVAAYKLTPGNPTLLEARDALLAAALARDPVDLDLFSQAFARRGAGVFAIAPDRFDSTNSGLVESYAAGGALAATAAALTDDDAPLCAADGILDSGETGTLQVTFRNVGNAPSRAASATVSSATAGVSFPDGDLLLIRPLPIFGTAEASVRVSLSGLTAITPLDLSIQIEDTGAGEPPPAIYGFAVNADEVPNESFTDGAESAHVVWSVVASDEAVPEDARWQRRAEGVTEHVYHCSSSPVAAAVDFVSPPLDVRRSEPLTLTLSHRFSFEFAEDLSFDGGLIEISSDGGQTWSDVGAEVAGYNGTLFADSGNPLGGRAAFVAQSEGYPEYRTLKLDLGLAHAGQTVQLRFRVASDANVAEAGWDIDDLQVTGVAEAPFDAVVAQLPTCPTGDAQPAAPEPAPDPAPEESSPVEQPSAAP